MDKKTTPVTQVRIRTSIVKAIKVSAARRDMSITDWMTEVLWKALIAERDAMQAAQKMQMADAGKARRAALR